MSIGSLLCLISVLWDLWQERYFCIVSMTFMFEPAMVVSNGYVSWAGEITIWA